MAKRKTVDDEFTTILQAYKLDLKLIHEKSQDTFEKQLSYLSAGALGFSMLFIERTVGDVSDSNAPWMLLISWLLFTLTLTINLLSHWQSAKNMSKSIKEIDDNTYDPEKVKTRIKIIDSMNMATIFSFFLGILLLGVFITINIMNKQSKPNYEKKGLTPTQAPVPPAPHTGQVPIPAPVKPPAKNK